MANARPREVGFGIRAALVGFFPNFGRHDEEIVRRRGIIAAIEHRRVVAKIGREEAIFLIEVAGLDVKFARAARHAGAGQQRFEDGRDFVVDDAARSGTADARRRLTVEDRRPARDAAFRFVLDDPIGEAGPGLRTHAHFDRVTDLDGERAAIEHGGIGHFLAGQRIHIGGEDGHERASGVGVGEVAGVAGGASGRRCDRRDGGFYDRALQWRSGRQWVQPEQATCHRLSSSDRQGDDQHLI